jgi:hypothetical protein
MERGNRSAQNLVDQLLSALGTESVEIVPATVPYRKIELLAQMVHPSPPEVVETSTILLWRRMFPGRQRHAVVGRNSAATNLPLLQPGDEEFVALSSTTSEVRWCQKFTGII